MMEDRRLPPGQILAAPGKWPLVGEQPPDAGCTSWEVTVSGCVASPQTWALAELLDMPRETRAVDIHCVTRWSKLNVPFSGVSLLTLIDQAEPTASGRFASFVAHGARRHSTSLPWEDVQQLDPLVALYHDNQPLAPSHGGPVRLIVPGRYFYKSLKWLRTIELLPNDRLGYWESFAGYHNRADPWREERFVTRDLDRRTVGRLIASRDFSGRDLLGVDLRGHALERLQAQSAQLRNADFRGCRLGAARFERACLANARFAEADLRGASFRHADIEGADFSGADLRGADLRVQSFLGVTFTSEEAAEDPIPRNGTSPGHRPAARLDDSVRVDEAALSSLTPIQEQLVRRSLHLPAPDASKPPKTG